MVSLNLFKVDIKLFGECRQHTDKYRIEKIFRMLEKSIMADGLYPERMNEHDDYFEPKNVEERNFWESCRELAKKDLIDLKNHIEDGKKGGQISAKKRKGYMAGVDKDKDKEIDFAHRESFIHATPEKLLLAIKEDVVPKLGGQLYFGPEPTDDQLAEYIQSRCTTEWTRQGGAPVRNVHSDLAQWLKNKKPTQPVENTKEIEEFVALWQENVYEQIKSVSPCEKVIEATVDNSKKYFQQAKGELIELVKNTKQRKEKKESSFLKVDVPYENIWLFAMKMLVQRRFYSDYLAHEFEINPAFFLKNIKTLADPFCDEYMDTANRWCHG